MPNFPCSDKNDQLSLKKHLMYKHNLSNTAGMKYFLEFKKFFFYFLLIQQIKLYLIV